MSYTDLTYFTCPLPEDIKRLVDRGSYGQARAMIAVRRDKAGIPALLQKRLDLELLILTALEEKYTLERETLYAQLAERVSDFSEEEMEALVADGTLDRLWIEGQERFIDNAAENAIKVHTELVDRLRNPEEITEIRRSGSLLHDMMLRMKEEGHCRMTYKVRETMYLHPHAMEEGEWFSAYLPLPMKDLQCTPGEIRTGIREELTGDRQEGRTESGQESSPENAPVRIHISDEAQGQRTACFTAPYRKGVSYEASFTYTIDAKYVHPDPALVVTNVKDGAASCPGLDPAEYAFATQEILPQVAFTPYLKALARELMGDETNPLIIARRFYDYITTVAVYRFVPPYFTKTNIPEYFATGLHGDCGMHALTFITLCRIAGIPARWQAGWYTRPMQIGNHDWAVFYVEGYGWLFADGSFGGGAYRAGDTERWDFYFGNLDPYRMVANTDLQQEFDPPFAGLRLDPFDNQTGEVITASGRVLSHDEFHLERILLSAGETD